MVWVATLSLILPALLLQHGVLSLRVFIVFSLVRCLFVIILVTLVRSVERLRVALSLTPLPLPTSCNLNPDDRMEGIEPSRYPRVCSDAFWFPSRHRSTDLTRITKTFFIGSLIRSRAPHRDDRVYHAPGFDFPRSLGWAPPLLGPPQVSFNLACILGLEVRTSSVVRLSGFWRGLSFWSGGAGVSLGLPACATSGFFPR